MNVLSLFNGISCGRVALERAEIKVNRYVSFEIDKYANTVAQKNYPDDEYFGDVTTADFTQFKGFDLVIGGSPCTYWSIAKTNREITPDGMGGQLFMHFVRAVKETGCKYFLYENNYSIHKDIKAFISEKLGVEPIMINSALVSAQQRKRCYWTNIPNVVQPKDKGILLKDVIENGTARNEKSYCLTARYSETYFPHDQKQVIAVPVRLGHIGASNSQGNRVYSVYGKSVCLQSQAGGGGAKTGLYKIDLPDGDYIIIKLTPLECERLQTLPDNYTKGVSDTQRYKCIGNGWTVDVIAHILSYINKSNQTKAIQLSLFS